MLTNKLNLKNLSLATVTAAFILTSLHTLRYFSAQDFSIYRQPEIITITLKNNEYFAISPRNDFVIDSKGLTRKPFGDPNNYSNSTEGLDFAWFSKIYQETAESIHGSREAYIQRPSAHSLTAEIKTATSFEDLSPESYVLQLDFSKTVNYQENSQDILLANNSCKVWLKKNPNYHYEEYQEGQTSVRISQLYQNELKFKLELRVYCPS